MGSGCLYVAKVPRTGYTIESFSSKLSSSSEEESNEVAGYNIIC